MNNIPERGEFYPMSNEELIEYIGTKINHTHTHPALLELISRIFDQMCSEENDDVNPDSL